jgi:hypothetical protein
MSVDRNRRLVEENYPRIAAELLDPLLDLLSMSREELWGDVDKFLMILVVGIRTTRHPEFGSIRLTNTWLATCRCFRA